MVARGCGGGSGRRRGRGRGARPPAQCPVDGTRSPRYRALAAARGDLPREAAIPALVVYPDRGVRKFVGNSSPRGAGSARAAPPPARGRGTCAPGGMRERGLRGDVGGPRSGGAARGAPAGPGAPTRLSLQCKSRRDKLLINSREEAAVSFFLLFFPCFHSGMAPSYARGSLTAQQFSLHFNILKKMQITTLWPF